MCGYKNESRKINIDVDFSKFVCYTNLRISKLLKARFSSLQANAFSLVRKVLISNYSDVDLFDSKLVFTFSSEALRIDNVSVACIQKNTITIIDNFSFAVDGAYLYNLEKPVPASFSIALIDSSGNVLCFKSFDFVLLPIEQFASKGFVKESLSSYVTPKDSAIAQLKDNAARRMGAKYDCRSFFGYQTHDPEVVMRELDCLYLALQSEGIRYSSPKRRQRV